jgi:molecular chaperone DnaJ
MPHIDYYKILEVEKNSDSATIKKSYRKLALKYHPDKNPNDSEAQEIFKKISEAYSILGNQSKRTEYDNSCAAHGHGSHDPRDMFRHFEDMFGGNIFDGMFNSRRRRPESAPGRNINIDMYLEFLEAAHGCNKSISLERPVRCKTCSGIGHDPKINKKDCEICAGTGSLHIRQGFMTVQLACNGCNGQGIIIDQLCNDCRGTGKNKIAETINLYVPSGIHTGQKLKVSGRGEPGYPDGDAIIRIFVRPSEKFGRDGLDIHTHESVTFKQACLGCEISVETIHGPTLVTITPGLQPGDVYQLSGAGIKHHDKNNEIGNQVVHVTVQIPQNLTHDQKREIEELKHLE